MPMSDRSPSAPARPGPKSGASPCRVLLVGAPLRERRDGEPPFRDDPDLVACGECTSLADGLELLRDARPDVVVSGMLLTDGDAFELVRRMGKHRPAVRVLVVSRRHEALCAERLLRAGALGYVMAGAPPDEIRRAIRRVAAGNLYISATLGLEFQRRFVHPDEILATRTNCALEILSTREFQIFQLIGSGMAQPEIANALCISGKTVESHRQHVRDKLTLGSPSQFQRCAQECATRCRLERSGDTTCELDPRHRPLAGRARDGLGA